MYRRSRTGSGVAFHDAFPVRLDARAIPASKQSRSTAVVTRVHAGVGAVNTCTVAAQDWIRGRTKAGSVAAAGSITGEMVGGTEAITAEVGQTRFITSGSRGAEFR